jgi:hypothetical protein
MQTVQRGGASFLSRTQYSTSSKHHVAALPVNLEITSKQTGNILKAPLLLFRVEQGEKSWPLRCDPNKLNLKDFSFINLYLVSLRCHLETKGTSFSMDYPEEMLIEGNGVV